jgi:uncharacterized protein GlcG (DUF336 family)
MNRIIASTILLATSASAYCAEHLTQEDVTRIIAQAVNRARDISQDSVIAVTDREGFVLGMWDTNGGAQPPAGIIAAAAGRAATAAFLSSHQNAFSTRTAGWIIQQHFPPGVRNTPPGPLVGVGFSNLFYSDVNRVKQIPAGFNGANLVSNTISPGVRAPGVLFTSLQDSPGGVPLYKDGKLVGGIGVTGDGKPTNLAAAAAILAKDVQKDATPGFTFGEDPDELVALAGQSGYRAPGDIIATNVLAGGVRLPYVTPTPSNYPGEYSSDAPSHGAEVIGFPIQASPLPYPYQVTTLGGVAGEIRFPFRTDPTPGKIGSTDRLTQSEVRDIITAAAIRASNTRAAIRLPLGTSAKVWVTVVGNPHKAGVPPPILGIFRVGEAPIFSWDVSAQKARTAVFFSNSQLAQSSRTVGFLAQRFFPPGLDGRPFGPYFGFQEAVTLRTNPKTKTFPGNPNLPNGMTIFPGGFPLYRGKTLVGAIGVSGDGIDQDDIIATAGAALFPAPIKIRADHFAYKGARLPYVKFPRDPEK